jgi:hypothetical protein
MTSNSDFILRTDAQLRTFWMEINSTPDKRAYFDKVRRMLENMKPGSAIIIENVCRSENLPMFIGSICMFADAFKGDGIGFSNDYQRVIKHYQYDSNSKIPNCHLFR